MKVSSMEDDSVSVDLLGDDSDEVSSGKEMSPRGNWSYDDNDSVEL